MKYSYLTIEEYKKKYGDIKASSFGIDREITPYERETSIILNDDDPTAMVYTAQKSLAKFLVMKNPHFKVDKLTVQNGKIVAIDGTIDKKCVKITKMPRTKFGRL